MSRRVSLILDDELYAQIHTRARVRRTTVSEEVRTALEESLSSDAPNAGLAELVGMVTELRPGPEFGSPAFRESMAHHVAEKGVSS